MRKGTDLGRGTWAKASGVDTVAVVKSEPPPDVNKIGSSENTKGLFKFNMSSIDQTRCGFCM